MTRGLVNLGQGSSEVSEVKIVYTCSGCGRPALVVTPGTGVRFTPAWPSCIIGVEASMAMFSNLTTVTTHCHCGATTKTTVDVYGNRVEDYG